MADKSDIFANFNKGRASFKYRLRVEKRWKQAYQCSSEHATRHWLLRKCLLTE